MKTLSSRNTTCFSPADSVRLRLAAVYIEQMKRPQDGMQLLSEMSRESMNAPQKEVYSNLLRQAKRILQA